MSLPQHLRGQTTHARRGTLKHAFSYAVDFVLIDPDESRGPLLFSRRGFNLAAVRDRDHGGHRGAGQGAAWARAMLADAGLAEGPDSRLRLLAQPRILGTGFTPVSFWLRFEGATLVAVIAEVNNTFGDRHSYLCHRSGFAPITASDRIVARKIFHVSPFQEIAGEYRFGFAVDEDRIAIRIVHVNGSEGVIATLTGALAPLDNRAVLATAFRRPLSPVRTLALIYWHALRLRLKGALYRSRPEPPIEEISR